MIRMQWSLTPPHEVLSKTAAAKALKETNDTLNLRLPLLKYSDAAIQQLIAQGIEVKLGDVIRINQKVLDIGHSLLLQKSGCMIITIYSWTFSDIETRFKSLGCWISSHNVWRSLQDSWYVCWKVN